MVTLHAQVVFLESSTKEMALHLWLFIMLKNRKAVLPDQGQRKRLNYAKMLAFAVAERETETQSREKLKRVNVNLNVNEGELK